MDMKLSRLEDKLDKHSDILSSIQGNLQEHMRRTQIAEDNIGKIAESIAPIQEHVALIRASGKIVTVITVIVGTVAALWQAFK